MSHPPDCFSSSTCNQGFLQQLLTTTCDETLATWYAHHLNLRRSTRTQLADMQNVNLSTTSSTIAYLITYNNFVLGTADGELTKVAVLEVGGAMISSSNKREQPCFGNFRLIFRTGRRTSPRSCPAPGFYNIKSPQLGGCHFQAWK